MIVTGVPYAAQFAFYFDEELTQLATDGFGMYRVGDWNAPPEQSTYQPDPDYLPQGVPLYVGYNQYDVAAYNDFGQYIYVSGPHSALIIDPETREVVYGGWTMPDGQPYPESSWSWNGMPHPVDPLPPPDPTPTPEPVLPAVPTEVAVNRMATLAFIAADPVRLALREMARVSNGSGGFYFEEQAARPEQVFRLIPQQDIMPTVQTIDGIQLTPTFVLMGTYDADIRRWDVFELNGNKYQVVSPVRPEHTVENRYQTKADVARR